MKQNIKAFFFCTFVNNSMQVDLEFYTTSAVRYDSIG